MKQMFNINDKNHLVILILLVSFLLYGNTLSNDYALNDAVVITENQFTKKGFSGIWDHLSKDSYAGFLGAKKEVLTSDRYKPLSLIVFSIERALFGDSAFVGHLFNILWYALSGFLLFITLQKLFPKQLNKNPWQNLALWGTLLWFFHPLHTEVVANIKGRDEIMAMSGIFSSFYFLLNYLDTKKIKHLSFSLLLFFLALLSKETALFALIFFPLALYFYRPKQFKSSLATLGGLAALSLLWYGIRSSVVSYESEITVNSLINNPFLNASISEKYATIFYILGEYLQLHIFPHPLTFDYSYGRIILVGWDDALALIGLFFFVILLTIGIRGFYKKNTLGFGILFLIISLLLISNIFYPTGNFMSESFTFLPSVGFSIAFAYLLLYGIPQLSKSKKTAKNLSLILGCVILVAYSTKTISRNAYWKNNQTLVMHDVNVSVYGAKSNMLAGGILLNTAIQNENAPSQWLKSALAHLELALDIYPNYIDAILLQGNVILQTNESPEQAVGIYKKILDIEPLNEAAWQNIFFAMDYSTGINFRLNTYQNLLKYNVYEDEIYLRIGKLLGHDVGDVQEAENNLKKGLEYNPNSYDLLSALGTTYGLQEKYYEAIEVLEKAIQIKATEAKVFIELGLSYYETNQKEKAKITFDKAVELEPRYNRSDFPI